MRQRYAEVQAVLYGLHADRRLAVRLGKPTTSARVFQDVWMSRFEADLLIIAGHVAPEVQDYLTAEIELLSGLVASLDEQVHVAMHGDPWHENILLEPERVWLLDCEDLSVGDPVVDDGRRSCFRSAASAQCSHRASCGELGKQMWQGADRPPRRRGLLHLQP